MGRSPVALCRQAAKGHTAESCVSLDAVPRRRRWAGASLADPVSTRYAEAAKKLTRPVEKLLVRSGRGGRGTLRDTTYEMPRL